jgi:hypothetical protein
MKITTFIEGCGISIAFDTRYPRLPLDSVLTYNFPLKKANPFPTA